MIMISRHVYYSLLIIIEILTFLHPIFSCPIPFDIQSKCRCAIFETGRVYIYCARQQLTTVPHFNNSNIIFDELVLSGNQISTVNKNAFNGLKLRKLEFQSNPIESIEAYAFIDLSNYLEELIFSTTFLSSNLSSNTFLQILSELPNLKRLSLRSFHLKNVFNEPTLLRLKKLTQLSLQLCAIEQIQQTNIFIQLFPNIERLDLSENRFEYIDIPLILSLKKLKILNLNKNKIRHLNIHPSISSFTFQPTNSLIELDLSYNGIETIDEHIFELISSQLEILNLRNNELMTEKHLTFLIHLYNLKEFYFDYNRLETINQLYLPLNLKILSLKYNRLTHINLSILTRLGHLEKLYLSSNRLSQWSSISNTIFPSLEILELDRNSLKIISLLNAPKLKQLNLDGNFLGKQIDENMFVNLPNLERLQLRDNQIESIDINAFRSTHLQSLGLLDKFVFMRFSHLIDLDLTNNSLTIIPILNNLNETLQSLSLRRNQICTIDSTVINNYDKLQTIELDQNPLHCDCRLGENLVHLKKTINGLCQSPPEQRNIRLNNLSKENLACSLLTLPQCTYLIKRKTDLSTTTRIAETILESTISLSSSSISSTTTSSIEEIITERIRIADLIITPSKDRSQLFIQWDLYPRFIDENINIESRRMFLKNHHIYGFKITLNSDNIHSSELLDVLQRNYTFDYLPQGEICLLLLRQIDYEKFCKQIQYYSPIISSDTLKTSSIIDSKESSAWYMNEPTKSILIGSLFGILLVLILLILVILFITRCPYLFFCRFNSTKYHQNNDSKSETLLVRPTPTNTIPWSSPSVPLAITHQHFYSHHPRPMSYHPSLSTQCTCPTHYHSSGSSSTDTSSQINHGQNYHIYQEILNEDLNTYRTCRPLHIDTISPPTSISTNTTTTTNPEQCQLCSLSVLV